MSSRLWKKSGTLGLKLRKGLLAELEDKTLREDIFVSTMCLVQQTLTSVCDDLVDLEPLTPTHFRFERAILAATFLPDVQQKSDTTSDLPVNRSALVITNLYKCSNQKWSRLVFSIGKVYVETQA